jgi:hypothetical protein
MSRFSNKMIYSLITINAKNIKHTCENNTLGFRFVLLPDWLLRNSVLLDVTMLPKNLQNNI